MARKFTLLFALFIMLQFASAQSYSTTPSNHVSGVVDPNGQLNLQINMDNISGSAIDLSYERLSNSCPGGWTVVLCDYLQCYGDAHEYGTMNGIANGDHGFLKLTFQPSGITGMGTLVYRVWNTNVPADEDTLTFDVNSVVAVEPYNLASRVTMYPNPSSGSIQLAAVHGSLNEGTFSLMNPAGSEIMLRNIESSTVATIDLSAIPAGIYLVKYETEEGVFTQKLIRN